MARPRTDIETAGSTSFTPQLRDENGKWRTAQRGSKPERWRARCKYRDTDGALRDVERYAATKAKADVAIRRALKERQAPAESSGLRPETTVLDAGTFWLGQVARPDSDLSDNTRAQYRSAFVRYVEGSTVASLTLREVNRVPVFERYLQGIADEHGTGAAKTARSVLSNIVGLAVRYQVVQHNAMRDVRPARSFTPKETTRERDTSRAFTTEERAHVLDVAAQTPSATNLDVLDLIRFLAGTGVRISEGLALRWEDVDLSAATAHVRGTKTASSDRVLSLPEWLAETLRARVRAMPTDGLVFPSPGIADRQTQRDRRNVARVFREVFDAAGFPWATPHTFRRTVATMLDAAGLPIALAANQLGHADPSMTARVYLGRKSDMSAAASVL